MLYCFRHSASVIASECTPRRANELRSLAYAHSQRGQSDRVCASARLVGGLIFPVGSTYALFGTYLEIKVESSSVSESDIISADAHRGLSVSSSDCTSPVLRAWCLNFVWWWEPGTVYPPELIAGRSGDVSLYFILLASAVASIRRFTVCTFWKTGFKKFEAQFAWFFKSSHVYPAGIGNFVFALNCGPAGFSLLSVLETKGLSKWIASGCSLDCGPYPKIWHNQS